MPIKGLTSSVFSCDKIRLVVNEMPHLLPLQESLVLLLNNLKKQVEQIKETRTGGGPGQ